ncbi:glycosyltransferase family 4 protein [Arthrobacter bambusae]|uniref:glycosyltransferase family 4 protein n=1 Tax=Arthrobacter TaxID=1663 RepID=UPI001F50EA61|nr:MULTISPECIES: glycosyltransferase family 4 protein [Arthrobacter]MCI0139980.1 glycosyltransferase family 4 protein [Arthrobacter bambusae]
MKLFKGTVEGWPARSNAAHNPFQTLLSDAMQFLGWEVREFSPLKSLVRRANLWHWHWPDGQFSQRSRLSAWARLIALLVLLQKARLSRTPIVWTAHNLRGHETGNRKVEEIFWPIFYRQVAGVHYISESSRALVVEHYADLAGKPYTVTNHGHYRDVYGEAFSKSVARTALKLDADKRTVVFCGKVRAYKGVTDLIQAFRLLSSDGIQLVIAGMATDDEERLVRDAAAGDPRITLCLKLLSDEKIKEFVCAADLVVLPYRKIVNSGSALLALSLDRPVFAANKGSIRELAHEIGPEWVMTYEELTPEGLASALEAAVETDGSSPDLSAYSWAKIALEVSDLYTKVSSSVSR